METALNLPECTLPRPWDHEKPSKAEAFEGERSMIHLDKLEYNDPSEDGLHTCDAGYGLKLNDYPLLERYPSN